MQYSPGASVLNDYFLRSSSQSIYPGLSSVIKSFTPGNFSKTKINCRSNYHYLDRYYVISFPRSNLDVLCYGIFFLDIKNTKNDRPPRIKQDIIAYDKSSSEVVYYSGLSFNSSQLRTMEEFNRTFRGEWEGICQYGIHESLANGPLINSVHHFSDADDPNLPDDSSFRQYIRDEIKKIKI